MLLPTPYPKTKLRIEGRVRINEKDVDESHRGAQTRIEEEGKALKRKHDRSTRNEHHISLARFDAAVYRSIQPTQCHLFRHESDFLRAQSEPSAEVYLSDSL